MEGDKLTAKEIKAQLCDWEKVFAEIHGRKPKKDDICLAPPNVKGLYKKYGELKRPKGKKTVQQAVVAVEKQIFTGSTLPSFEPKKPAVPAKSVEPAKLPLATVKPIVKVSSAQLPMVSSSSLNYNTEDFVETLYGVQPRIFGSSASITDFEIDSVKNLCPLFHKPKWTFTRLNSTQSSNSASMDDQTEEEEMADDRPFEDVLEATRKRKLNETEDINTQEAKKVCLSEETAADPQKKQFKPAKKPKRRGNVAGFKLQLKKKKYVAVGAKQLRNAKFNSKKKFSNWKGRKNFGR